MIKPQSKMLFYAIFFIIATPFLFYETNIKHGCVCLALAIVCLIMYKVLDNVDIDIRYINLISLLGPPLCALILIKILGI